MKSPKLPRLPKLPKTQTKNRIEKVRTKKIQVKKPGKRTLMVLLAVLMVLAGLTGAGFFKGFLNGFLKGSESEGKKTEAARETQSGGAEKADYTDLQSLKGHLGYSFIKTLRSDQYMIKYRTTTVYGGKSYEIETTYAVSGSSISLVAGDRATIVRDGKVYMLNHMDQSILSWDVADSGDLKRIDTDGIEFVGSSEDGGLVCEEYKTASAGIKLYFDGKSLLRMETNINKIDTVMNILKVGKKVDDSLFAVPEDYRTTEID